MSDIIEDKLVLGMGGGEDHLSLCQWIIISLTKTHTIYLVTALDGTIYSNRGVNHMVDTVQCFFLIF